MVNTTTRAWGSPGRYIQGPGELMRLAVHTKKYGKRIIAVIDEYSVTILKLQKSV